MRSATSSCGSPKNSVAAARLEAHERPQEHPDRLARQPADALELGLARVGVEEREERAQVGEVDERQALRVGVVEDEREARLLGVVRAEDLAEELRPEVGDVRAHRDAGAEAAEREELDRERGRREREAEVGHPLLGRPAGVARDRQAGDVALDVGDEHGHAGGGELLGHELEGLRLARAGRAGDEAVAVERGERDAHGRVAVDGAVKNAAAQVERGAIGRVGGGDRLVEVGAHGAGRLPGRRTGS